ncbi:MAG: adenylate cyclase [Solirubrobacteraceae bacterium]|nr:adenylate cyclase [Solirubrobacteraceae bacterium]
MRWATRSRFARIAGLLVAVASAAIWIALHAGNVLSVLELDSVDARHAVRSHGPVRDVAFVAVDDRTENALRRRWPFKRSLHAQVIDRLRKAGARAIAYDVQFTAPTTVRQDNALIEAIARTPDKLALATTQVDAHGNSNVLGGEKLLKQLHARSASAILNQDKGGVLRRFPYETDKLKSFAVVAAEIATGHPVDPASFKGKDAWIDYLGPPGTVPTYSYSDVLAGRIPASRFKGRVVVVGVSAPELQDVHPWSSSSADLMAGGEIQANAISTVLRGLPLDDSSNLLDELIIALLAMLAPAIGLRFGVRLMLAGMVGATLLYVGITLLAFHDGTILPVVDPLGAIATAMFGTLGVALALGTVERARVRDAFARFVPEAVVGEVLASTGDDLRLGGVRRDATVLFSDLRGFTSFSETLAPDRVIEVLNRYLESMSDAILDNGGTLVAYMGDGIMAVFGAPLEQPDHADRALAAARDMAGERLDRFNQWLAGEGFGTAFAMGIGLNTGSVMSGNVGSKRRLEYTAIGDTTNTAARLEGMTKGTPHQLFLADSTRTALAAEPDGLVDVGELEIRGRTHGLRVWALASVDKRAGEGAPAATAAPAASGD